MTPEQETEVLDAFDRVYDKAISHAIGIIEGYCGETRHNANVMYPSEVINKIISQLKKLKSNDDN